MMRGRQGGEDTCYMKSNAHELTECARAEKRWCAGVDDTRYGREHTCAYDPFWFPVFDVLKLLLGLDTSVDDGDPLPIYELAIQRHVIPLPSTAPSSVEVTWRIMVVAEILPTSRAPPSQLSLSP